MNKLMTAAEFREARDFLGLSAAALADALMLGKDGGRTVRKWESGQSPISGPVTLAVRFLIAASLKPAKGSAK